MQRGFSIIITSPALPSYIRAPFFASGKAARFAESRRPRTLSGHLIPIRYFSLLSCSSLSWASCLFPLPPAHPPYHLPHCWTLSSSLLFPRRALILSIPIWICRFGGQPAACIAFMCCADSWQAVTDEVSRCSCARVQDTVLQNNEMIPFLFFLTFINSSSFLLQWDVNMICRSHIHQWQPRCGGRTNVTKPEGAMWKSSSKFL